MGLICHIRNCTMCFDMAQRKKNAATNPVLYFKPNQFPGVRIKVPSFNRDSNNKSNEETTANESSEDQQKSINERAEYFKHRFDES